MAYIGTKPADKPLTAADIADSIITSAKIVDATITNSDVASSIITGQTAETSIAGGDSILIYDDSATALRKMTRTNFVSGLGGLTEADQWRLTTDLNGDQTITTNLERVDSDGSGYLGTGMTQSSGVFTFPSTGYYLITAHFRFVSNATDNQQQGSIAVTINNSTYAIVTQATANFYSGSVLGTVSGFYLFDVTSTTTHKVRFEVSTMNNEVTGNTTANQTYFTFLKLGDT